MRFLIVFIVIQAVVSQRCKMICKLFVWYIIYVYEHVTKQAHATKNSNKTPFDHSVLILYFTVFPSSVLSVCMSNYHFFRTFVMFYIPRIPTEANVVTLKFNVSRDNRHPVGNTNRPVRLFRGNLVPHSCVFASHQLSLWVRFICTFDVSIP